MLGISRPSEKQSGAANPVGAVDFFWSSSDVAPSLADAFCCGSLISGAANAEITIGDFRDGFFWARTASGDAIELHIHERRL